MLMWDIDISVLPRSRFPTILSQALESCLYSLVKFLTTDLHFLFEFKPLSGLFL
jgi:hypothetical protein